MNKKGAKPENLIVDLIILFLLFLAAALLYAALTGKFDISLDKFTKLIGWD